jgi:hypothetical protein
LAVLDKNPREMFYGEMLKVFTVVARGRHVAHMPALGIIDIPAAWSFDTSTDATQSLTALTATSPK